MKRLIVGYLLAVCATLAHASEEHPERPAALGAVYKAGEGITLSQETRNAVRLTLVDVDEGALSPEFRLTAQVYRTAGEASQNSGERQGCAYASAMQMHMVSETLRGDAPAWFQALSVTGRVFAVEHTMVESTGQCEALIEIPDPNARLAIGDFVHVRLKGGQESAVVRVPRSAILESAAGTFAFVQNGNAFLRTPIVAGARDTDHVEVVEGLYAGDVVAATAVETLYLIELRATKGGGHSH